MEGSAHQRKAHPCPLPPSSVPPEPRRVAVVGAGMVGLATAWFLQERGVEVTVIDRDGVAAGSSWGNAGWLTPGIATPLPEPAVLKYGLRAVLSPSSPVYVPPSARPDFLRFVTGFTRHSTMAAWKRAMGALVPVNDLSLASFDLLRDGGVAAVTHEAKSFTAAYRTVEERQTLLEEIEHIHASGGDITYDALTGDEARAIEPALADDHRGGDRPSRPAVRRPGGVRRRPRRLGDRPRRQDRHRVRRHGSGRDRTRRSRRVRGTRRRAVRPGRRRDRCVARPAGPRLRRQAGRAGRPRLLLQRRRRRPTQRPGLLPRRCGSRARRSATGCGSPG